MLFIVSLCPLYLAWIMLMYFSIACLLNICNSNLNRFALILSTSDFIPFAFSIPYCSNVLTMVFPVSFSRAISKLSFLSVSHIHITKFLIFAQLFECIFRLFQYTFGLLCCTFCPHLKHFTYTKNIFSCLITIVSNLQIAS